MAVSRRLRRRRRLDGSAKVQTSGRTHTRGGILQKEFEKRCPTGVYLELNRRNAGGLTHLMSTKDFGDYGEEIAASYLEKIGYRILERNYRFERSELDLVALSPDVQGGAGLELVFVEVKIRAGLGFGRPEEAVSEAKRRNLVRAAQAFLHERRLEKAKCRFDVISIVERAGGGKPEIQHFERAFWAY